MINYFFEDIEEFTIPVTENQCLKWIEEVLLNTKNLLKVENINYIFCSDDYLLKMNQEYLEHNYYTDIITFNYNETNTIKGDLFISYDRIKDNYITFQELSIERELLRVMTHGILHLIGFDDHTEEEKIIMREHENKSINLLYTSILNKKI